MSLKRIFQLALAMIFLGMASGTVQASELATHHFEIDRPEGEMVINEPSLIKIRAIQENGKVNTKANHDLVINVTSGGGARAITSTTSAKMSRGICEIPLAIKHAGQNIVQVSAGDIFNSISVNVVLPQASGTGVLK